MAYKKYFFIHVVNKRFFQRSLYFHRVRSSILQKDIKGLKRRETFDAESF